MTIQKKNYPVFRKQLAAWYQKHHRKLPWRETRDPYRIWISEVMLQQTQVATALPYYFRFLDRFPTIRDLANADLEIVLKMWEGLGYYARARNFHKAARIVVRKTNGVIPDNIDEFKALPGVGDYIGAAVQSIVFDHCFAVVDGNVKRVIARFFCISHPVNASSSHRYFQTYADDLLDGQCPGLFNQAMMELGALVCIPKNPKCGRCPVPEICKANKRNEIAHYPKRLKTKKIPTYHIAVGIAQRNGKLLITRRKLNGLLGGLWEFPGGKLEKGEDAKDACTREIKEDTGLTVETTGHLTTIKHAYTHFKIIMDIYYCRVLSGRVRLNGPIDFKWIQLKTIHRYAFPKANLKFIPLIEESKLG